MAWNEPGDQDPWNSGPKKPQKDKPSDPLKDLEALKSKLEGLVGQGGGMPNGMPGAKVWGGLVVVAVIIWLLTGIYIVDPAEKGVVLTFGKYSETVDAGPHWRWPSPIGSVKIVNVSQVRNAEIGYRSGVGGASGLPSIRSESLMLTQDENIVDIKIAVQYNVKSAKDYLFSVSEPDRTLREAVESALRSTVGKNTMDFILTEGRNEIVSQTKNVAQKILDHYKTGLNIISVNLQDAQPPDQVQAAFADVVKAREDKQRFINEAQAYANDIIPKARGQASRILEEAKAYKAKVIARSEGDAERFISLYTAYKQAPEVTRDRLYIDTFEAVLQKTSKVILDSKTGNNLLYLPLDQLLNAQQSNRDQSLIVPNTLGQYTPSLSPTLNKAPTTSANLRNVDRTRRLR